MPMTIDLPTETSQWLESEAAQPGLNVAEYLTALVEVRRKNKFAVSTRSGGVNSPLSFAEQAEADEREWDAMTPVEREQAEAETQDFLASIQMNRIRLRDIDL